MSRVRSAKELGSRSHYAVDGMADIVGSADIVFGSADVDFAVAVAAAAVTSYRLCHRRGEREVVLG